MVTSKSPPCLDFHKECVKPSSELFQAAGPRASQLPSLEFPLSSVRCSKIPPTLLSYEQMNVPVPLRSCRSEGVSPAGCLHLSSSVAAADNSVRDGGCSSAPRV